MNYSLILLLHICGATVGVISGLLSMVLRKGPKWHAAAGTVFVASMVCMSLSAAFLAVFHKPNAVNLVVGLLTFYLVATGWWAGKRRSSGGAFDLAAFLFSFAVGAAGWNWGIEAVRSGTGTKDGMPAAGYFIFGTVALLCALTDLRILRHGGVGVSRLARHLWRMSLALVITTLSFYPGQARLFPQWLRDTNLLSIPLIWVIGMALFWRIKVARQVRARKRTVASAPPVQAMREAA